MERILEQLRNALDKYRESEQCINSDSEVSVRTSSTMELNEKINMLMDKCPDATDAKPSNGISKWLAKGQAPEAEPVSCLSIAISPVPPPSGDMMAIPSATHLAEGALPPPSKKVAASEEATAAIPADSEQSGKTSRPFMLADTEQAWGLKPIPKPVSKWAEVKYEKTNNSTPKSNIKWTHFKSAAKNGTSTSAYKQTTDVSPQERANTPAAAVAPATDVNPTERPEEVSVSERLRQENKKLKTERDNFHRKAAWSTDQLMKCRAELQECRQTVEGVEKAATQYQNRTAAQQKKAEYLEDRLAAEHKKALQKGCLGCARHDEVVADMQKRYQFQLHVAKKQHDEVQGRRKEEYERTITSLQDTHRMSINDLSQKCIARFRKQLDEVVTSEKAKHAAVAETLKRNHAAEFEAQTEMHKKDMDDMNGKLEKSDKVVIYFKQLVATKKQKYKLAKASRAQEHAAAMTALRQKNAVAMATLKQEHTDELTFFKREYAGAMSTSRKEHADTTAKRKQQYEHTMASVKEEHASALEALKAQLKAAQAQARRPPSAKHSIEELLQKEQAYKNEVVLLKKTLMDQRKMSDHMANDHRKQMDALEKMLKQKDATAMQDISLLRQELCEVRKQSADDMAVWEKDAQEYERHLRSLKSKYKHLEDMARQRSSDRSNLNCHEERPRLSKRPSREPSKLRADSEEPSPADHHHKEGPAQRDICKQLSGSRSEYDAANVEEAKKESVGVHQEESSAIARVRRAETSGKTQPARTAKSNSALVQKLNQSGSKEILPPIKISRSKVGCTLKDSASVPGRPKVQTTRDSKKPVAHPRAAPARMVRACVK